jgi:hypothetical protein
MSFLLADYLFFSFSFLAGLLMILEGCRIILFKQQITPIPTQILYGMCLLVLGKASCRERFSSRPTPKDLRSYASYVLFFGPLVIISSFIFLFSAIL